MKPWVLPIFLAWWKYQYSSETERTLAGRSSRLPDGVGVEILMILLGSLHFAKLSFSEVASYFLFFLYSDIASARRCSQPALSSKNLL